MKIWQPIEGAREGAYAIVADESLTYATYARRVGGLWLEYDGRAYDKAVSDMPLHWFMELPELDDELAQGASAGK